MPKRAAKPQDEIISKCMTTQRAEKEAYQAYQDAQEVHLATLREARKLGETCENLANALGVSKQWIHKWTTYGREHNKIGRS